MGVSLLAKAVAGILAGAGGSRPAPGSQLLAATEAWIPQNGE
jgi:hypothetical protein